MQDITFTCTGGGAIFAIGCIIYFIVSMLVEISEWVEKKRKERKERKDKED